jgi:hypothetical protein
VEGVKLRRSGVLALAALAVALVAGCSSSGGSDAGTPTTTVPKATAAWVAKWKDKLVTDYAPAQEAFLAAIQSARVADVQAAAQKVKAANETLGLAIQAAGDPPKTARVKEVRLLSGLSTEHSLVDEILARCTGADPKCQQFVTQYGKNNRDTIVPALDGLGAAQ